MSDVEIESLRYSLKLAEESMGKRIAELEAALRIIALRLPEDQSLSEPVDWQEVANTFVSVARNALDSK